MDNEYKPTQFSIYEKNEKSKIRCLNINNCPKGVWVFQLNENTKFSNYFDNTIPNINKTCDFIIIYNKQCFIIDIKSDSPNSSETTKQLKNSYYFMTYLNKLCEEFFQANIDNANIYCGIILSRPIQRALVNQSTQQNYVNCDSFYKSIHLIPDINKTVNINFTDIVNALIK